MASSESFSSIEPWAFRPFFDADAWLLPETTFSRDNDLLARALQRSISNVTQQLTLGPADFVSPPLSSTLAATVSNASGCSEPETTGVTAKRKRSGSAGGKAGSKRRSRTTTKSQTRYITADPANFRQLVQQVTGARNGGGGGLINTRIVKPEPQRPGGDDRLALPMLDTSAFLSNHHQESLVASHTPSGSGTGPAVSFQPNLAGGGGAVPEFETYPAFPTLESWKVM